MDGDGSYVPQHAGSGEVEPGQEARQDHVLRTLVGDCQRVIEPLGFRLDGRSGFADANWVRFERRAGADRQKAGREVLLLAHGRQEQALVADLYAVEGSLNVYIPRRRLVQHYDALPAGPRGVGDLVSAIQCWWPGEAPPA